MTCSIMHTSRKKKNQHDQRYVPSIKNIKLYMYMFTKYENYKHQNDTLFIHVHVTVPLYG